MIFAKIMLIMVESFRATLKKLNEIIFFKDKIRSTTYKTIQKFYKRITPNEVNN